MATTIRAICYKSKVLSNGESPLMLRITKDRKLKYVSLGVSVNPEHWDFSKNQPKAECPNRDYIELLIADKLKMYTSKIVELKATSCEYTSDSLVEQVRTKRVKLVNVEDILTKHINDLIESNRRRYAQTFTQLKVSMEKFRVHLKIPFSEIDLKWLREYELFLRKSNLAENSIGVRIRSLRVIYNVAISMDAVSSELYPFKKYKVSKLHQETSKRALSRDDVERVINYSTSDRFMRLPIDIFAFTYYCGGINFVDIAHLTKDNIVDGRLIYKRQKTKKLIKLPLQQQALALIEKYHNEESPYLFPILSPFHQTEIQKANRIHKVISNVNDRLKRIGADLGLPITLTTYVARHSQATVMKRAGVPTAIIREIMGHSSERVTQIYLDSFDNEQIDQAMKNLL